MKVRVWHKEFKKFLPKEEWVLDFDGNLYFIDIELGGGCIINRSKFIIQVSTGVEDKNGKEIYDGDIVNFNGKLVAMEWNRAEGCFWGGSNSQRFILQYFDFLKVVGNILENPELLDELS